MRRDLCLQHIQFHGFIGDIQLILPDHRIGDGVHHPVDAVDQGPYLVRMVVVPVGGGVSAQVAAAHDVGVLAQAAQRRKDGIQLEYQQ